MHQRWIAGTEDAVGGHIGIRLGFHRRLNVDLRQDAESFDLQRVGDSRG